MQKLLPALFLLFCMAAKSGDVLQQVLSPRFVVYFAYNDYQLSAENIRRLDSLVYLLKHETPAIQNLTIEGHCDSIGSNKYNDALSVKRAGAVADYFRAHGIADSLLHMVNGYGKHRPETDNSDDAGRAKNRRVEISFQLHMPGQEAVVVKPPVIMPPSAYDSSVGTLDLSKVEVNDILELKDINFYPDRHVITHNSMPILNLLLNTMVVNPALRIEIRGHVCCIPKAQGDAPDEDTYTNDLSLRRAQQIYLYLKEKGIAGDRMIYIGLGGRYPKVPEFTDSDKAKNRRVEIRILSK